MAARVLYSLDAAVSFSPTLERRPTLQYEGHVYASVASALTGKGTSTVLCQKGLSDISSFYRRDKNVILSNCPFHYFSANNS